MSYLSKTILTGSTLVLVIAAGATLVDWDRLHELLRFDDPAPALPGPPPAAAPANLSAVAAIGRIEPRHGVIRVAGPPRPVSVVGALLVEEGDLVDKNQPLAVLAGIGVQRAEVKRLEAQLANADRELARARGLFEKDLLSDSELHAHQLDRDVAAAGLEGARAGLALLTVRAPIAGQVLEIHARAAERIDAEGLLELGDTSAMYAVAEVYETDIGRVRKGQKTVIRSPALARPLIGVVERIGLKVGKRDVLTTDPVADVDARVVEVDVRLAEPERAAALTNLRVDVIIGAGE